MKKKKLFSILCAVSLMSSMIATPTFAEEFSETPDISLENIVEENEENIVSSEEITVENQKSIIPSEEITEEGKQNIEEENQEDVIEKNMEDNETIHFVIATKVDGLWTVNIKTEDISKDWKENSGFEIVDFAFAENNYSNENGELELIFTNSDDYTNGDVATLLFYNQTEDKYKEMYIDFSDTGLPTFSSEDMKNLVEGETNIFSKIKSIVLPQPDDGVEPVIDAKQWYSQQVEPPTEEIFAESNLDKKDIVPFAPKARATTSATVYYVYDTSGRKTGTYNSPFKAIETIAANKLNGYSVKQSNDAQEIFKLDMSSQNKFYKFQFTNFYGSTTSAEEAEKWTKDYNYAHVVRCDGIFGANTDIRSANQPYSHSFDKMQRNPEIWALEGQTGAYVYRKSISYNGYKSISSMVNLSSARLKFDDDTKFNAYVYMSSNSNSSKGSIACDLGLLSASSYNGNWYLISNRTNSNSGNSTSGMYIPNPGTPLVTSKLISGEYRPTADVKLQYVYRNGSVFMRASNDTTKLTQSIQIKDTRFDTSSPNICLMTGTSLVPDMKNISGQRIASDIKSGAYLKNVVWTNNYIYSTTDWTGTERAFNGSTSNTTNYLLIYDTDNASCSVSGGTETVNIHYNPTYKQ